MDLVLYFITKWGQGGHENFADVLDGWSLMEVAPHGMEGIMLCGMQRPPSLVLTNKSANAHSIICHHFSQVTKQRTESVHPYVD